MNPETETRILAAYGAARALADVDGHGCSTLVVVVERKRVVCRAQRFGLDCMWSAPLSDRDEQNWKSLAMVIEDVLDGLKGAVRP
jgi:hypothetical protein